MEAELPSKRRTPASRNIPWRLECSDFPPMFFWFSRPINCYKLGQTASLFIPFQITEQIYVTATLHLIPMAARSKACVCGGSLQGLRFRIPPGALLYVCCECCVWSGRGLCYGTTTRLEESCQVWFVWVWSLSSGPLGAVAPWDKKF